MRKPIKLLRSASISKRRRLVFGKDEEAADFLALFYFALEKPLTIWEKQVITGSIKRVHDVNDKHAALQILGSRVLSSNISTPPENFTSLGIKLPILNFIIKFFGRPFSFEVQVIDSLNTKRRIRFSNLHVMSRRSAQTIFVPINMEVGWNDLKIDLAYIVRSAYGTRYKETTTVQIFSNCYLRAVYFSSIPIADNAALLLIRKSFYNRSNEEKTNSKENPPRPYLKLAEYKGSYFTLRVPMNLQEFLKIKASQNISFATEKPTTQHTVLGKIQMNVLMNKQQDSFPLSQLFTTQRFPNQVLGVTLSEAAKKFLSKRQNIQASLSSNTFPKPQSQTRKMLSSKDIDKDIFMDIHYQNNKLPEFLRIKKSRNSSGTKLGRSKSSIVKVKTSNRKIAIAQLEPNEHHNEINEDEDAEQENEPSRSVSDSMLKHYEYDVMVPEFFLEEDEANNRPDATIAKLMQDQLYGFLDCNPLDDPECLLLNNDYDIPIISQNESDENTDLNLSQLEIPSTSTGPVTVIHEQDFTTEKENELIKVPIQYEIESAEAEVHLENMESEGKSSVQVKGSCTINMNKIDVDAINELD